MSSQQLVARTAFEASQRITSDGFDAVECSESAPPACEHGGCPASGFRTKREYYRHLEAAHDGERVDSGSSVVEEFTESVGGEESPADT